MRSIAWICGVRARWFVVARALWKRPGGTRADGQVSPLTAGR